ncbi:MAG: zinc ribbon domain-containing protein [Nitrospirae bacterium]|nr:MAG: zinc ribbon domain-containing protein [Nitrospirota bacterium]
MPIYEYRCLKCNNEMEVMQKFSDEPLSTCPECGGQLRKLISNTSFVLKGTGWYVTDYASPERKKAMEAEKSSSGNGKKDTSTEKSSATTKS